MTGETYTGGCLCGAVRYEASVAPAASHYCHCRMCQRAMGNIFGMFVMFPMDKFRFTRTAPKRHQSSAFAERGFCAECGTPILFQYVNHRDRIGITLGSLDHPEDAPPERHIGMESHLPWLKIDDGLPRGETKLGPDITDLGSG